MTAILLRNWSRRSWPIRRWYSCPAAEARSGNNSAESATSRAMRRRVSLNARVAINGSGTAINDQIRYTDVAAGDFANVLSVDGIHVLTLEATRLLADFPLAENVIRQMAGGVKVPSPVNGRAVHAT